MGINWEKYHLAKKKELNIIIIKLIVLNTTIQY